MSAPSANMDSGSRPGPVHLQNMGASIGNLAYKKSVDMPTTSADVTTGCTVMFPPGTVRLEDATAPAGEGIILQPRPSEDPNDPLNWSTWRKYLNFGLASLYVLMVSEFINSATPTWGPMHTELGFSYEILNDSYAVGSAFLAIGALVLVPFALKFGRRPLYLFSTLVLFAVSIWSAKLQTVADLMLVNVFCTAFGALAEVIVQMTIADVFFVHQRGKMNSIYIWLWQVSVSLGPLIAGFITTGQGWRWVWWWNAVFFGFCSILVAFGYEETKYCPPSFPAATPVEDSTAAHDEPEVDVKPACNLKQDLPEPGCAKVAEEGSLRQDIYAVRINHNIPMKTYAEKLALSTPSSSGQGLKGFLRHMYQPLVLLTTIPAVAYTALVYGILVATQDVMSTTFSTYMTEPPYKFNASQIGLMNLPKLAGVTIGSLVAGPVSDVMILCLARRNNGIYEPEQRLWSIIPFIAFIPAGALMFGIGLNNGLPWPVIAVGLFLYKLGIAPINSLTITYLTDSYKDIIGDALVGVTVVRNTFSTVFIFAITPWIAAIGIKWVIIIIVLISVVFLSFTGVLIVYGKTFRARTATRYAYYASLQYKER